LLKAAELAARLLGVVDYLKSIPYDLKYYRLLMPESICRKHSVTIRNLWDRARGEPKNNFYDVVLEVAAMARQNLKLLQKLKS
jgi:NADH dehydrogenase [ubiquinone] 1 alpha subcomplex assembly factor 6